MRVYNNTNYYYYCVSYTLEHKATNRTINCYKDSFYENIDQYSIHQNQNAQEK
jgi:hypothetical protein